jgi:hypothetical protein
MGEPTGEADFAVAKLSLAMYSNAYIKVRLN